MMPGPGWGSGGKVEQPVDSQTEISSITIEERRTAEGLDRHVPIILRDGVPYDADLDRFFLDLPFNGVRSPHSLRAYGYECGVGPISARRLRQDGLGRYARGCRCVPSCAAARGSRCAHLRRVLEPRGAALEKLYRWAELEGLVGSSPFTHREVWRQGHGDRRARVVARNEYL